MVRDDRERPCIDISNCFSNCLEREKINQYYKINDLCPAVYITFERVWSKLQMNWSINKIFTREENHESVRRSNQLNCNDKDILVS